MMSHYQRVCIPNSFFVNVRQHKYHVLEWGNNTHNADLPLVFFLHGWMDVAASFQFIIDEIAQNYPEFLQQHRCIALDWRGFGRTKSQNKVDSDSYRFLDYLGDLDALVFHFLAEQKHSIKNQNQKFDLIGHSMGGNVALMYAGTRTNFVRRLVILEGLGVPDTQPSDTPTANAQWLDDLQKHQQGKLSLTPYQNLSSVARRLCKSNPRLTDDKAQWLANEWAQLHRDGKWHILGDAAHKVSLGERTNASDTLALYGNITAQVQIVLASDDTLQKWWPDGRYALSDYRKRLQHISHHQIQTIPNSGHMLHHDQPQAIAEVVVRYLTQTGGLT